MKTITEKHLIHHTSEDHEISDILGAMTTAMRNDTEADPKPNHALGLNLSVCYDPDMPESIVEAHQVLCHRALPIAIQKAAENGLQVVDIEEWHGGNIKTDSGSQFPSITMRVHLIHAPTSNYARSVLLDVADKSIAHMNTQA